jgi:hypothetical protein
MRRFVTIYALFVCVLALAWIMPMDHRLVSPVRAAGSFSLSYLVVYAFSRAALFLKRRQAT